MSKFLRQSVYVNDIFRTDQLVSHTQCRTWDKYTGTCFRIKLSEQRDKTMKMKARVVKLVVVLISVAKIGYTQCIKEKV